MAEQYRLVNDFGLLVVILASPFWWRRRVVKRNLVIKQRDEHTDVGGFLVGADVPGNIHFVTLGGFFESKKSADATATVEPDVLVANFLRRRSVHGGSYGLVEHE